MHFRRVTVAVLTVAALLACDEATPGGTGPTADAERDAQRPRQDQYIAREDGSIRDSEPGDVPDVPELPDLDLPPDAEAVDDGPTGGTPPPVDAARLDSGPSDAEPVDASPADVSVDDAAADAAPACDVVSEEVCNTADDDCDGRIDEGFGVGERCDGEGACGIGRVVCLEDLEAACNTEPGAPNDQSAPERCNAIDDDCDGAADEQPELLGMACYGGPVGTSGVGVCRSGQRACVDGALADCANEVRPGVEACNRIDDDCDGRTDERLDGEARCGLGICRLTSIAGGCFNGEVRACAPGAPIDEDANCDGIDGDCDGRTDEGYVVVARCGVGRCEVNSTPSRCVNGQESLCVPGAPLAVDSTCNATDDDCDGRADEGYAPVAQCGVGACRAAARPSTCVAGVETPCAPGAPAANDLVCNAIDDDCDGRSDEDYRSDASCGVGFCALDTTPSRCVAGEVLACEPGAELTPDDAECDAIDADCDGQTDEDYVPVEVCGVGECARRATPSRCAGGEVTACAPGAPLAAADQTCDGDDDDCNGVVDEDAPVVAANGERRLTNAAGDAVRPSLVTDDAGYAVTYSDNRSGRNLVYMQRLNPQGELRGVEQTVTNLAGQNTNPSIASTGNGYAVAWTGTANARPQVYLTILDAAGAPRAGLTGLQVNQAFDTASLPRIVRAGDALVVVWQMGLNAEDIYGRRFDLNGAPLGAETNLSGTANRSLTPAIVYNPDLAEVAVVWSENDGAQNGSLNLYFARLGANGQRAGRVEPLTLDAGNESAPAIAYNGTDYGVVWQDTRNTQDIWFDRVTVGGIADGSAVAISPSALQSSAPSIVSPGAGPDRTFGVAWSDRRDANDEVYFARVGADGVPRVGLRVSNNPGTSFLPSLAARGDEFAVSWYDNRDGNQEIYFSRGPMGCP